MTGIPSAIGRYRVERLLGQGAMGSVYLARDPELHRAVAIKTVRHLDLEEDRLSRFLERFRNEARAAARLSHPSIVAVYDVGEDEAVGPYLVFEYVAGSTLKQILRGRGALPPADVVRLGRQIASALDTAHAAGVIHRDIKPDNILVSPVGDAKLADFGVARVPDAALTKEGQFLGTPCYAAPETIDEARYGPHSDLFSFAAVLYETVTGVRAFPGDDAISVAHHVVHDDPELPSAVATDRAIPKEVDRVLMRGLAKDPDARYGSASELVEELRRAYVAAGVLADEVTGAQPLATRDAERPAKGSSWAFGLVLGGGLAVGVALVIAFGELGAGSVETVDAGSFVIDTTGGPHDAGAQSDDGRAIVALAQPDAGPPAEAAAQQDAGRAEGPEASPPDAGSPSIESMTAFEREEAAKDEVRDARARLSAGDLDGAEAALRRARHLDPGNADIAPLLERVREARGGPAVP